MAAKARSAFRDKKIVARALKDSILKLNPKTQVKNPVMLLVFLSAILTTGLWIVSLFGIKDAPSGYTLAIAVILWFTVLFANFAEAIAEGRGKAQADALRAAKKDVDAHKIPCAAQKDEITVVSSVSLKKGDIVIVKAGEQIPADGEVIEGAASVDESAITGESAPVIRESGGDRSAVTGGTTVLSDWIVVEVTSEAGESFLDQMIAMVEGAARKKTPNEIALQIFLVALSIIFILVTVSLYTYSIFSAKQAGIANPTSVTTLVALLVCLAPTTIGALLSAIGIAGMSRLNQANVLAMSGRAIEAAGDVDILMLDKTGTITLGNRQAHAFIPVDGATPEELADAAQLSSLADETPEGRSVVILAKEKFGIRARTLEDKNMRFIPFSAKTRMSGVDYDGVVTGIAQLIFPEQANGSIIEVDGKKYGSALLGQQYTDETHMWGRVMNIDVSTYKDKDGKMLMYAAPSNLTPASEEYAQAIAERVEKIRAAHPEKGDEPIPVDLVTCSGSGLDPHISPAAAEYQVPRLAKANGMTEDEVHAIVEKCTKGRFLGVLGEKTVNVLEVNLRLDGILK